MESSHRSAPKQRSSAEFSTPDDTGWSDPENIRKWKPQKPDRPGFDPFSNSAHDHRLPSFSSVLSLSVFSQWVFKENLVKRALAGPTLPLVSWLLLYSLFLCISAHSTCPGGIMNMVMHRLRVYILLETDRALFLSCSTQS